MARQRERSSKTVNSLARGTLMELHCKEYDEWLNPRIRSHTPVRTPDVNIDNNAVLKQFPTVPLSAYGNWIIISLLDVCCSETLGAIV